MGKVGGEIEARRAMPLIPTNGGLHGQVKELTGRKPVPNAAEGTRNSRHEWAGLSQLEADPQGSFGATKNRLLTRGFVCEVSKSSRAARK
jgi:hypothetical protein